MNKYIFIYLLIHMFIPKTGLAQELVVKISDLKNLEQTTHKVKGISFYEGRPLSGRVSEMPGQSYSVVSPIEIHQAQYLINSGIQVEKGTPFAVIKGPEVHHYIEQFQQAKLIYEQSKSLYENQQALFKKGLLNQDIWLQTVQLYSKSKLDYEEYQHFFDNIEPSSINADSLIILAPIDGYLLYQHQERTMAGDLLTKIIPHDALRISASFALNNRVTPTALRFETCEIAIATNFNTDSRFFSTLWTEPLPDHCVAHYGQQLNVQPIYNQPLFSIPKNAVFDMDGQYYVLVKSEEFYEAVEVELLSSSSTHYTVSTTRNLGDFEILTSSVSAVQGIMMGIGD
uniref:hypothetical protein n=1 Tax=Ningiella ruwaisensis TaxID=2364274 RepID=UPI00109F115C|nr:hypothetical protein [Ningiella ruwaisensis]